VRVLPFPIISVLLFTVAITRTEAEPPQLEIKHNGPVWSVIWTADGKTIISAGQDGIVRLTDAATGKEIKRIDTKQPLKAIALSPDGKLLAVKPVNGAIGLWSVDNGNLLKNSTLPNFGGDHLAFFSDGSAIMCVGIGSKVLWHHAKGGASGTKSSLKQEGCAAVSPDGKKSVWCLGTTGRLLIYEYDGKLWKLRTLQVNNARALAFAPDGATMAVAYSDNSIRLWDLAANKEIRKYDGLREPAATIVFSANGKALAAVGTKDTTIRIWDAASARLRRQLTTNRTSVTNMAMSPDGRLLATSGSDGKAYLWSVATRDLGKLGPPIDLSEKELEILWLDLSSSDLNKADNAFKKLVTSGKSAVPYLAKQVRAIAVPLVEAQRIEELLKELDSEVFATREKASNELARYGELAEVPLKKLTQTSNSPEAKRRAMLLLEKLKDTTLSPERLRALEALEVLEHIRSPEARKAIEDIAQSALIAQIQREASDAVQRLKQGDSEP
jgi:WD40 repeat protein